MAALDVANPSYKVDLNIPPECATYKIIVENNVYNLICKSGLTTRLINDRVSEKNIDAAKKKVTFKIALSKEEAHIFNYLLDRSELTIAELFDAVKAAHTFFLEYDITSKSAASIDKYIAGLSQYQRTWTGLTSKPDYNLTIFSNRMLPYFSLECMDWVKANLDTLKGDYPAEILGASKKHEINNHSSIRDDYHEEMNLATRNNNFLEWQVLPIDKYPNMDELVARILLLKSIGLKKQYISMICRFMLSPRECHIIKRPEIWEILKPEMKNRDFDVLIKYCMYYALYIMKQEETIMFSQVNNYSRVLFKLSEANQLPTFDNCHIDRNPYIVQLTNDTSLGKTMPFYLHGKRSLTSKEEFARRFAIATGGAFNGFDLKSIGAAITGSILIPCVHRSPLEDGFDDVDWERERACIPLKHPYMIDTPASHVDEAFANYLEYYYPSYVSLTDADYKKQVLGIGDKTKPNERVMSADELKNDDIEYEVVQENTALVQSLGGIAAGGPGNDVLNNDGLSNSEKKKLENNKHKNSTEDGEESDSESEDSEDESDTDDEITPLINTKTKSKTKNGSNIKDSKDETAKMPISTSAVSPLPTSVDASKNNKILDESTAENKSQPNATEYNQLADIDISITTRDQTVFKERALLLYDVIRKNCEHRGPVHIKEVRTIASIKYKIYGPGVSRPMDIFRIPYDPIKMVKKFHVHAVKMYYDGDVVMFRSCISCLLSGVGESYKWFSCNKVPADVLLKYAQRGFTIILNAKERDAVSKYIMSNDRWGNIISKLKINPEKIYCCATAGHPFFRPGMFDCGIRMSLRRFERDSTGLYANTLVVSQPRHVYPYGEVLTHDSKKIYMPDVRLIGSILDYIENGDAVHDSHDIHNDVETEGVDDDFENENENENDDRDDFGNDNENENDE